MKPDTIARMLTFVFAFTVIGMAFYGLVLYENILDDLTAGALIAWGGAAIGFVFQQEAAKASATSSQRAFDKGLATPTPEPKEGSPNGP